MVQMCRPAVLEACALALKLLVVSQSRETRCALQLPLKKPDTLDKQMDMPTCLQHSDHLLLAFRESNQTTTDIPAAETVQKLFFF